MEFFKFHGIVEFKLQKFKSSNDKRDLLLIVLCTGTSAVVLVLGSLVAVTVTVTALLVPTRLHLPF
jgi:hypothetical protein